MFSKGLTNKQELHKQINTRDSIEDTIVGST